MQAGHIRLNQATGEWVIYAPSRRKRPQEFQQYSQEKPPAVNHLDNCPFCFNKYSIEEPILLEMPAPDHLGWQTRVIRNKFPALVLCDNCFRTVNGIYLTMPGYGQHEVVIESPNHYQTLATMSVEEVGIVIETYYQRYIALMKTPETMMTIIFRNHGKAAGASMQHPHSQIIATGIVPRHRRWQEEEAQRYFDRLGHCVYCDILEFEMSDRKRMVRENDSFFAFVPFAAEVPFEIWIMPKRHQADFGAITQSEKSHFAEILKDVLATLYHQLNNPDYNLIINSASRYKAEEPQIHWYCQIQPRLTTRAGFEIGSGIRINPSIPEIDAEFLRI